MTQKEPVPWWRPIADALVDKIAKTIREYEPPPPTIDTTAEDIPVKKALPARKKAHARPLADEDARSYLVEEK